MYLKLASFSIHYVKSKFNHNQNSTFFKKTFNQECLEYKELEQ